MCGKMFWVLSKIKTDLVDDVKHEFYTTLLPNSDCYYIIYIYIYIYIYRPMGNILR